MQPSWGASRAHSRSASRSITTENAKGAEDKNVKQKSATHQKMTCQIRKNIHGFDKSAVTIPIRKIYR